MKFRAAFAMVLFLLFAVCESKAQTVQPGGWPGSFCPFLIDATIAKRITLEICGAKKGEGAPPLVLRGGDFVLCPKD